VEKYFNVTGSCDSREHYMVDLLGRLEKIKKMIDDGKYFTVNRGRQYGKTTMLKALARYLEEEYIVVNMDFQLMDHSDYKSISSFVKAFAGNLITNRNCQKYMSDEIKEELKNMRKYSDRSFTLADLFYLLNQWCSEAQKPIVLMIDEVDQASNNQVFLDFLSQLRGYYLNRENIITFQSVILAGVHDVRNLRQKIRPDMEHKHNGPWNIATKFEVDMSFSSEDISGMLKEYEKENNTGMNIDEMAKLIYDYTSGYPVLVSGLCKFIDEEIAGTERFATKKSAWTKAGFLEAEKKMMSERMPLFESLINKLEDDEALRSLIHMILFEGKSVPFNPDDAVINTAMIYGFAKNKENIVCVANRLFETRIYNWFLSLEITTNKITEVSLLDKNYFIKDGNLDMKKILTSFVKAFNDIYGSRPEKFLEETGRKYFMLYMRPIINWTGNYYIESRTRDNRRTDMIIDYLGKQYIVELKIWRGEEYNSRGEEQLIGYLEDYGVDEGYMLSFNFNKDKKSGINTMIINEKTIVEAVV